jgi:hypothetical protein
MKINSKTKLNIGLTNSCFDDDEDWNNKQKNTIYNLDYGYDYDSNFNNPIQKLNNKLNNKPLYTLVWYECEDCKQLLRDVKRENKKILYIDGSYYFFDENDETNSPLFYKNDELITTDLFGIYEELFYNKIN